MGDFYHFNLILQSLDSKYLYEVKNLWQHLLPTASKIIVPVKQISVFVAIK